MITKMTAFFIVTGRTHRWLQYDVLTADRKTSRRSGNPSTYRSQGISQLVPAFIPKDFPSYYVISMEIPQ